MLNNRNYLRLLLAFLFIMLAVTVTNAQKAWLTAYTGYMVSGKVNYYLGEADVNNSASYGVSGNLRITPKTSIGVLYNRCDPKVKFLEYGELKSGTYNMSVEYFHAGLTMDFSLGSVKPYGTITIGATRFHLKEADVTDSWRFSVAPAFGTRIFFNKTVGLNIQARLFLPMEFKDAKIFIDSDTKDTDSTFRIPIVQSDYTAGIFVVLK